MTEIIASIAPEYCELIADGIKKTEVRKTLPKDIPFKVYMYCTKKRHFGLVTGGGVVSVHFCFDWKSAIPIGGVIGNGKVIGEFVCNDLDLFEISASGVLIKRIAALRETCLSAEQMKQYAGKNKELYGWKISDLVIYDVPRDLSEFGLTRPPQSWCYV